VGSQVQVLYAFNYRVDADHSVLNWLMSHYPLITIGIPTYNRADGFLGEAITSALRQTYSNVEIIVSDNCSTDNTEDVVKSFNETSIRYYRQPVNLGPQKNFNFCVEKARGDYFQLLQDDDLIDDDFIETCIKATKFQRDIGIIRTGTRIIDENGNLLKNNLNMAVGLSTEEFFRFWFDCKTALYLCSTLFNTKRLQEIGGFPSKHNLFSDVCAEIILAARYGRVDVQEVKASFRKHSGEMTFTSKTKEWCKDSLSLLDVMCDIVPRKKNIIRREGMRYLAKFNYNRTKSIRSPIRRFWEYLTVFHYFKYKHLPPNTFKFYVRKLLKFYRTYGNLS